MDGEHGLSGATVAPHSVTTAAYREALDYLFGRTTGAVKLGLERTTALLHALGDPHRRFKSLHIAGTNGKGSSVATAEALLSGKGWRVARYTSPHLVDFRERMVIGGEPIPAEFVTDWIARRTALVEQLDASFFEATTAMALDWFGSSGVDIALIETGLGGRLDATNVVSPLAAGVTSIGFDHMEYLGGTLREIAGEKAGIFKAGTPAVIGGDDAEIAEFLTAAARDHRVSEVRVVREECVVSGIQVSEGGTTFLLDWKGERRTLWTPLAGAHQAWNVAFTLVLLDAAGAEVAPSMDDTERLLPRVRVPGRFQRVGKYVFDVAHNGDGSAVVARTLDAVSPARPVVLLLSVLGDKDWRRMIDALAPVVDRMVLTVAPTSPRSRMWSLPEAVSYALGRGVVVEGIENFDDALKHASAVGETVLVTGSFHTVGDAMSRLQVSPLSR